MPLAKVVFGALDRFSRVADVIFGTVTPDLLAHHDRSDNPNNQPRK